MIEEFVSESRTSHPTLDKRLAAKLRMNPQLVFGDLLPKCIVRVGLYPMEQREWVKLKTLTDYLTNKLHLQIYPELEDVPKTIADLEADAEHDEEDEDNDGACEDGEDDEDLYRLPEDGEDDEDNYRLPVNEKDLAIEAAVLRYLAKKVPGMKKLYIHSLNPTIVEGTHFQRSTTPEGAIHFDSSLPLCTRSVGWLEELFASGRPFCVRDAWFLLQSFKPPGYRVLMLEYVHKNPVRSVFVEWILGNFDEEGFSTKGSCTIEYLSENDFLNL